MVLYYAWIVSLLVSFCQLVSGATNNATTALSITASLTTTPSTTTTEAATSSQPTATAITPTTTGAATSQSVKVSTSQPSSTATPTPPTAPFIRMTVTFETENSSKCNQGTQEKFENKTRDLYNDDGFNRESVFVSYSNKTGKCVFNVTVIFGQKLSRTKDVIETFENAIKKSNFNGVAIKELNIDVYVDGVRITLGEYSPTEADCKRICCGRGAGGEIPLTRSCIPTHKCANFKNTTVEKDCTKVCDKHCSGAINNVSLMAMLLGAFIHWFLK